MLIRKLFKFENAHIVRNCSTDRCKYSIHGHSYKVEVLVEASKLDNGQMVYDFSLLKRLANNIMDSFDHSIAFWNKDDPNYIEMVKKFSARWISLPVSPSAEQMARLFFVFLEALLGSRPLVNNEDEGLRLHSVIVHETDSGYAQAFTHDAHNPAMGEIAMHEVEFSPAIKADWLICPPLLPPEQQVITEKGTV